MFIKDTALMIETHFQETYASATRTSDAIQHDLVTLFDDFSLSDESIGDFDATDLIN